MHLTRTRAPIAIAGLLLAVLAAIASRSPEERRVAVRVEPRTERELATALSLTNDVWSEDVGVGEPVVEVLTEAQLARLASPYEIVVDDIDRAAADERSRLATRAAVRDWFGEYRDADELNAFMDALARRHPDLASVRTLGTSVDGEPIRALEISHGGTLGIVLDGGHHAREWISVMVPACIADRLVAGYAGDPRIRRILDETRFFIAPLVNPDGYRYSWTTDRYWRKNRRGGHGVDLSRNYGVAWGQAGSSADPRSPNYRGESPFSEPESRAVRDLFEAHSVAAHVDFHSFSQVIAYPWGYQRVPPPDRAKFAAIADRMSSAIHGAHGERYRIIPGSEFATGSSGNAGDWSYGTRGALSFLVELRPASAAGGGFVLPPEQIAPTCDEAMAATLELADWMIDHR
ncbi:MAG: M14 metallopeptidase family protein [Kofleriaceae bacterium]